MTAETKVRSPGFCRQCQQHYEFDPHVCQLSSKERLCYRLAGEFFALDGDIKPGTKQGHAVEVFAQWLDRRLANETDALRKIENLHANMGEMHKLHTEEMALKNDHIDQLEQQLRQAEHWRDHYRAQWLGPQAVPPVPVPETPDRRSFHVVERFEDGRSVGYWDGGNSRSFVSDINKAVQFCRKEDAFWVTRGWHWSGTKITEHVMLGSSEKAEAAQRDFLRIELPSDEFKAGWPCKVCQGIWERHHGHLYHYCSEERLSQKTDVVQINYMEGYERIRLSEKTSACIADSNTSENAQANCTAERNTSPRGSEHG